MRSAADQEGTTPQSTIVRLTAAPSLEAAASSLAGSLESSAAADAAQGFLRVEVPVADGGAESPLAWLAAHPHPRRLCFEADDESASLAGVGFAAVAEGGLDDVRSLTSRLAQEPSGSPLRFLLTNRFEGRAPDDSPWAAFGETTLVLPLVELRREAGELVLAVNLDREAGDAAERAAEAADILRAGPRPARSTFRARAVAEAPDAAGWTDAVEATLADISAGRLDKCVLARTRTYALEGDLDPFALLQSAAAVQPGTFRFGIQVGADRSFIGATPEVLFRRRGAHVESEALAGTRVRGTGDEEDARLGEELLASPKDRAEHDIVRQHIEEALAPMCSGDLEVRGPRLRQLSEVQHLDTRVRGTLAPEATDADLLDGLHPTPAVCGVPADAAREAIASREPFDRGLYTGAVGLVGRDEAIVTVGIRSALHLGSQITLLAGAGIVAGSQPDAEWAETGDKMSVLDRVLRTGSDA